MRTESHRETTMTTRKTKTDGAQLRRATPVLMCADYTASRSFYVDSLGFRVVEEGGEPARFGILERQGATVFLNAWRGARAPVPEVWDAYVHVEGVDSLREAYAAAGVPLTKNVHDTTYGMREFEVTDPDGNVLCFGESIE